MRRQSPQLRLLHESCGLPPISKDRAANISSLLEDSEAFDWQNFLDLASLNRIIPQVYLNLSGLSSSNSVQVPTETLAILEALYNRELAYNVQLSNLQDKLLQAFAANGLEVLLIKGAAVTRYGYRYPNVREVFDIDILLKDGSTLANAKTILSKLGLGQGKVSHAQHVRMQPVFKFEFLYRGGPLGVDLHLAIGGGGHVFVPSSQVWRNAVKIKIGGIDANITSSEDTLLITCSNALSNGRFLFRDLLDTITVLKHSRKIDWSHLIERAQAFGLLFPLYSQLVLSSRLDGELSLRDALIRAASLLPRRFQDHILDASEFDASLPSISLRAYRDNYLLSSRVGYTYPVRQLTTHFRESMQSWAKNGDSFGGLSSFAVWKSKDMVKRAAEKLRSS